MSNKPTIADRIAGCQNSQEVLRVLKQLPEKELFMTNGITLPWLDREIIEWVFEELSPNLVAQKAKELAENKKLTEELAEVWLTKATRQIVKAPVSGYSLGRTCARVVETQSDDVRQKWVRHIWNICLKLESQESNKRRAGALHILREFLVRQADLPLDILDRLGRLPELGAWDLVELLRQEQTTEAMVGEWVPHWGKTENHVWREVGEWLGNSTINKVPENYLAKVFWLNTEIDSRTEMWDQLALDKRQRLLAQLVRGQDESQREIVEALRGVLEIEDLKELTKAELGKLLLSEDRELRVKVQAALARLAPGPKMAVGGARR